MLARCRPAYSLSAGARCSLRAERSFRIRRSLGSARTRTSTWPGPGSGTSNESISMWPSTATRRRPSISRTGGWGRRQRTRASSVLALIAGRREALPDRDYRFVGGDGRGVEVAHAPGPRPDRFTPSPFMGRTTRSVSRRRHSRSRSTSATQSGDRQRNTLRFASVRARVDQMERVAVREPALLRGRHDQRLAVLPTPRPQRLPVKAVDRARHVAAVVLGPHGEEERIAGAGDARFQQAAADRQLVVGSLLGHLQLGAVERAAHGAHGAVGAPQGTERQRHDHVAGSLPVAMVQRHPLRAVAGVQGGGQRFVPRHPLAAAPAARPPDPGRSRRRSAPGRASSGRRRGSRR